MSYFRKTLLPCALALTVAACAGDGPPPPDSTSWFARLQRGVFDQSCISAGCHNPQTAAAGLILTEGRSFDDLVGVAPTNPAAIEAGMTRVQPFAPDLSFLLAKVTEPGPGAGARMPLGDEPLSQEQIDTIREWIELGAPEFDTPPPGESTSTPTPTEVPGTDTPTAVPPTDTPSAPTATALPDTPTPTAAPGSPTLPPATATTPPGATLQEVQEQILTPRCATPFCHSGENPSAGLSLEDGQSFDELVGVVPANPNAAGEGRLLVDPGNTENSFLVIKVVAPPAGQGLLMPLIGDPLTADEVGLIESWIRTLD